MFGVFFFISLYMQNILGYSPVQAGAAFLPMTILVILVAPMGGRLADRFGSRWLMAAGMALLAVHLLLLTRLELSSSYVTTILPSLMIGGVGIALVMTPASAAAMKAVSVDKAGVGSAVLNAFRQVGGSVGIALMGAIVATQVGATRTPEAFLNGLHSALLVAALIALGGAVLSAILVRDGRATTPPRRSRPPRPRPCEQAGSHRRRKARHAGRLPAPERREAILDAALRVFCSGSYAGTTTAEIAAEAGVTEPVIYRHFASKRALWLACMDEAWARFRVAHEKKLLALGEEHGIDAFGQCWTRCDVPACCSRASGCRVSPRPPRTPRSSDMSAGTCAPPTTSSPTGSVKARNAAASPLIATRTRRRGS